ncbi:Alpha-1,3-mannosyl-glycoprotein 4-beta-N-acetylglucosaminyltransferase B [Halotydeus destructor]|nr:Alpha-1,3-mannosyl-glycoprotein 4-beta-N-acetylglucosaminyltransferase B [Halotydeus destructor]
MRILRPSLIYSRPLLSLLIVTALIVLPLMTMSTLWVAQRASNNGDPSANWDSLPADEVDMKGNIVELNERIKHAEMLNNERKLEIMSLRLQLDGQRSVQSSNDSKRMLANPMNNLVSLSSSLLQVPSLSSFLPNLLSYENSLSPAYRRVSKNSPRSRATIVFGVPTVQRPVESYLMLTLTNLISNLSPEEMKEVVIVVFIAETNQTYVERQIAEIDELFYEHIESGLLEVISPPASYYPHLTNSTIKITLNDPINRVIWRTKQNLDFAYLMMYCQPKGTYYVQLEDDVIPKPGYVSKMKAFAYKKSSENLDWFILDFCLLGFIGKMFKSRDLGSLALWFVIFRNDKPVDWLLGDIAHTKYCSLDADDKKCKKEISKRWIQARPSLFQHIGTHSSLKGKVQKLRDKGFGKIVLANPYKNNPNATCTSSIAQYQQHGIQKAYDGQDFYWSTKPKAGDRIVITFKQPLRVDKYLFRSGNIDHPDDKVPVNSTLEVLPVIPGLDFSSVISSDGVNLNKLTRTSDDYFIVASFQPNGVVQGKVPIDMGRIRSMRITVSSSPDNWLILSELFIKEWSPS